MPADVARNSGLKALLTDAGASAAETLFVELIGRRRDGFVLVDGDSLRVLGAVVTEEQPESAER
jgi:hypothetical protein